jgi:hypothetical protein
MQNFLLERLLMMFIRSTHSNGFVQALLRKLISLFSYHYFTNKQLINSEGLWFIESLPVGRSETLTLTFKVPADAEEGVEIEANADGITTTQHS